MISLTHEKNKFFKEQKHVIYAKKSFARIKMITIIKMKERLKIIIIIQENLEELLIVNVT